jgi:SAM-dependent methyltransferase
MSARQWAGHVSALVYRWTNVGVSRRADADLFSFLGTRLVGAHVLDCGCGPGMLTEALVRRGAARVLAVDVNSSMVRQARARMARLDGAATVEVILDRVDALFLRQLDQIFDLVVFKRFLYSSRPEAIETLRAAIAATGPSGVFAIIHPERSLWRYAFGDPARPRGHTVYHLFNRCVSVVAARLRIVEYRTYTMEELLELLSEAVPDRRVLAVASGQVAYNIAAVVPAAVQPGHGRCASYTRYRR